MKLSNAIKKAEKAGFTVESKGSLFWFETESDVVEFHYNGAQEEDRCSAFYIQRKGTSDDIYTDYFSGYFENSMARVLNAVA